MYNERPCFYPIDSLGFLRKDSLVNNTIRTIMVWLVIGVILTMVFMQVASPAGANSLDSPRSWLANRAHLEVKSTSGAPQATSRDVKNSR